MSKASEAFNEPDRRTPAKERALADALETVQRYKLSLTWSRHRLQWVARYNFPVENPKRTFEFAADCPIEAIKGVVAKAEAKQ